MSDYTHVIDELGQNLRGRRIVLGVSGGIAAYKAAELTRALGRMGVDVHVVLTEAGARFVTPLTFQALSGNRAWSGFQDGEMEDGMPHITLGRGIDAILVAPASANFIARLAAGFANDLLSTLCLARDCPLFVAPAMNRQMWENPATRRNVALLQADGIIVLGPCVGEQACGETGPGRMLEPEALCKELTAFFTPKLLAGRKVMLTAGPTFEAIDPVRGITNSSSGKMGYALAAACARAGAEVVLVSGPVTLPVPAGVRCINATSALQMRDEVFAAMTGVDVFIAVAAVADYRPAESAVHKIKKSGAAIHLELVPNPDILAEVAALPEPPFCVGFAAESQELDAYAEAKRRAKRLPMLVGNLLGDGLGGDENTIVIYDEEGRHPLPRAPKTYLAQRIVERIACLLSTK
ncbi:MAG: bifunctional phosphopantothenoylcysteine decarboxylase/phosphopantothenate--cysteine ligase CoaBC [Azoarcus sp.]|jgi:phosphopantothenoylcysteine decarboxylase/phosphopantothenate--cysteine ligase|nr:bifunctional phosphopantothenoylcysteine decarboxylase/phosphopantothenate--cysteine ligase CoaBC [Azoarcus sp.]